MPFHTAYEPYGHVWTMNSAPDSTSTDHDQNPEPGSPGKVVSSRDPVGRRDEQSRVVPDSSTLGTNTVRAPGLYEERAVILETIEGQLAQLDQGSALENHTWFLAWRERTLMNLMAASDDIGSQYEDLPTECHQDGCANRKTLIERHRQFLLQTISAHRDRAVPRKGPGTKLVPRDDLEYYYVWEPELDVIDRGTEEPPNLSFGKVSLGAMVSSLIALCLQECPKTVGDAGIGYIVVLVLFLVASFGAVGFMWTGSEQRKKARRLLQSTLEKVRGRPGSQNGEGGG